ncbi:MAG: ATP-dependent zinc metalloprotease FtsH [Planctomycetota bacterium]|jgi:cell division protease FtsH
MNQADPTKQPPTGRPGPERRKAPRFSMGYLLLVILGVILLGQFLAPGPKRPTWSDVRLWAQDGKLSDVVVTPKVIRGKHLLVDEKGEDRYEKFEFPRVTTESDVKFLDDNVPYTTEDDSGGFWTIFAYLLFPLLLIGFFIFLMRRMNPSQQVMSFGKSKAKIYAEKEVQVTFADVAGIEEAVDEVREIVDFLMEPQKFQALGARIPKGVLLLGAPGTGKTLLARAVAGEAKVPFFSLSGSDFVEMFVGVGASRVRDLFRQAVQHAPCIVFIDELDALGKSRGVSPVSNDEREQTLNALLVEMDGFDPNSGVILMSATNRPEILDNALMRPGRFDRQIVVDKPDIRGREAILDVHARKVKLDPEVDLAVIAARTPGFAGADLANVINEAALLAARRDKSAVTMSELEEAIDRTLAGLEKKKRVMTKREKEIVSYHEAGHALVASKLPDCDPVHRISIIPRGMGALGHTLQLPTDERWLLTHDELGNRLAVLLGGRAAETIVFGQVSTGAHNDLERASAMARRMVTEFGMSDRLGPVSYEREQRTFLGMNGMGRSKDYSEETAREIDEEVKRVVTGAEDLAVATLESHRDVLERIALRLSEVELIEREELDVLLAGGEAAEAPPEVPSPAGGKGGDDGEDGE